MAGFGIYTAGVLERPRHSVTARPPATRFQFSAAHTTGDVLVIDVSGELDAYTAPEFDRRMGEALATPVPRGVIVDLRGVTFLGVAVLEVLLDVVGWADRTGVGCRFVGGPRLVDRALGIAGLRSRQASFDDAMTALVEFREAS